MPYRFAIIGCGHIAQRHAEHIAQQGLLLAVCDVIPQKAIELADKFNATPYFSVSDLLQNERPDIVSVCSPNGCHAAHTIEALNHGSHILCEKPMSISVSDGKKMIECAERTGKKIYVVKQNRYNPPVLAIKKLINENKLGTLFGFQMNCFWNRPADYYRQASWRGSLAQDGGILFTQFSHFIDLLYWFLGDVEKVAGWRRNDMHQGIIEFEDSGMAMIEMKNGATGTINYSINSYKNNMEGSFTLFGEKGTVKIGGQYLNELEYFSVENETKPKLSTFNTANNYGFYQGSMSNHGKVYENLIRALKNPDHAMVEAAEALKTVEIIENIYRSSPIIS
jgi:predicted dehydrogenase